MLSNFGFAEGSGYGLYNIQKFTNWNHVADRGDIVKNGYSVTITNSKITGSSTNYNTDILYSYNSSSTTIIFKVTGLVDGQKIFLGRKSVIDAYVIDKDGIYRSDYNIPQEGGKVIVGIGTVGFTGECNITIEQIPEYEGYLVTDGVDDIASSNTVVYEADFTFIGEWKFIQKDDTVAGINSSSHLYIQNRYNRGATVMINSTFENKKNITDYMTFKAITSKGKGYDENWNEVDLLYGDGNKGASGVNIGGQGGTEFCHMIFKNMALYMNKVFTKDECIKAYNYLQTLKSK